VHYQEVSEAFSQSRDQSHSPASTARIAVRRCDKCGTSAFSFEDLTATSTQSRIDINGIVAFQLPAINVRQRFRLVRHSPQVKRWGLAELSSAGRPASFTIIIDVEAI